LSQSHDYRNSAYKLDVYVEIEDSSTELIKEWSEDKARFKNNQLTHNFFIEH